MSISIMDIAIQDSIQRERERKEEERPRVNIPQPPPDYLRYVEEENGRKEEKEDSGRGVTIFQM